MGSEEDNEDEAEEEAEEEEAEEEEDVRAPTGRRSSCRSSRWCLPMWMLTPLAVRKEPSHTGQRKRLKPPCPCLWASSSRGLWNRSVHSLHLCGRDLMCTRWCALRPRDVSKTPPQ